MRPDASAQCGAAGNGGGDANQQIFLLLDETGQYGEFEVPISFCRTRF
jgi:hypothetical protein